MIKLKNKLISIFILPPNIKTLKNRLINRDMKDKLILRERMSQFKSDLLHWKEYDYVVINNDLEKCYQAIMSIIDCEKKEKKFLFDQNTNIVCMDEYSSDLKGGEFFLRVEFCPLCLPKLVMCSVWSTSFTLESGSSGLFFSNALNSFSYF